MAYIDTKSILAKAQKAMNTTAVQKRVEQKVDNIMMGGTIGGGGSSGGAALYSPSDAAKKFIDVLQNEIKNCAGSVPSSGQLGSTAVEALTKLEHGVPVKVGSTRYQIPVSFTGDLRRDSLDPSYFGEGVNNIAALLNNGYSAKNTVYGIWLGHWPWNIPSLTHRSGAHFIESAIRDYMANYAKTYGVIDIKPDDIYEIR